MPVITCIEDLRELHKKNAPKAFYDYVDAGSYLMPRVTASRTSARVAT